LALTVGAGADGSGVLWSLAAIAVHDSSLINTVQTAQVLIIP
jgi:hypothetical protein